MTDLCTIGPVSVTDAHLFDNSKYEYSNSASNTITSSTNIVQKGQFVETYSFGIIMPFYQALQIKGVVEQGEIIWINTSSDLTDNNYFQHKGWVILTALSISEISPKIAECTIEYIKVSDYEDEYLTMDYTRGTYDGISLDYSYTPGEITYILEEHWDNITTNWRPRMHYPSTSTATYTADAANDENDLSLASGVDGSWAYMDLQSAVKYYAPFTLETVIDRDSLASSSNPFELQIAFSPTGYVDHSSYLSTRKWGDWFQYYWSVGASTSLHGLYAKKSYKDGRWVKLCPAKTVATGAGTNRMGVVMEFEKNGKVSVWINNSPAAAAASGAPYVHADLSTYTLIYSGPCNIDISKGIYLHLAMNNKDSTAETASVEDLVIYDTTALNNANLVALPADVLATDTTLTHIHRTGSDGDVQLIINPSTDIRFLDDNKLYDGSVKLLSTNNTGATSRQVFSTGMKLTPTTTTLHNSLTRITFDADELIFEAYDAGGWQAINRFNFGTAISYIKPLYISSDRVELQVNQSKVILSRGMRFFELQHPNDAPTYTVKDNFWYNGALDTSIVAGDAISMMDEDLGYYSYTYADAPSDTYRLVFGKRDPTIIYSDSLPVDTHTMIGWAVNGDTGQNTPDSLVRQWYKQTRTGVSLKQVI